MPPLVNAHIHLELSHLRLPESAGPVTGFTDWIGRLLASREKTGTTGEAIEQAARDAMRQQYDTGVIGIGDIGNTDIGEQLATEFPGTLLHFREVLGRSPKSRQAVRSMLAAAPPAKHFSAHAPYSTHAELIQSVKERARRLKHPFPIHAAEPPSENELLSAGTGELHEFLVQRGFISGSAPPPAGFDNTGSVQYLHTLGVLDELTICVHCIHVSDAEISMLADSRTKVCLCPGSNRYLHVGLTPVEKFLDHGILPALGTDSRASNPEISIWREIRIMRREHPQVQPEDVLAMATLGGARALGIDHDYGTLDKGKKSDFLAVPVPEHVRTAQEVAEYLTADCTLIKPVWIN